MFASGAAALTTPLPSGETRLAGDNRYGTAAAISAASFDPPVDVVYIASGTNYPDALAAGSAAARDEAPILLVKSDGIGPETSAELDRLQPAEITLLGGPAAVSAAVETQLAAWGDVTRIQGEDRYATAAEISNRTWDSASTVFIASGATFADALSAGPAGAKLDSPLLLTKQGVLPEVTRLELQRLTPSQVYILGGTSAVSAGVEQAIKTASGGTVTRLSGADRYATSVAVARQFWSTMPAMFFATGLAFPDAVAGTPAAAVNDAPIVLTKTTCMPKTVAALKAEKSPGTVAILGGTSAIAAGATSTTCVTPGEYTGSGDSVVTIAKPDGQTSEAIATISYSGDRNFIVTGLDNAYGYAGLLVNEIGNYSGTVLLTSEMTRLEIESSGPWTIQVKSLSQARSFSSGIIRGTGDDVLRWYGTTTRTAYITHQGESNFVVWSHQDDEDYPDLLVNEIGEYEGGVVFPGGPATIEINADGSWSIGIL